MIGAHDFPYIFPKLAKSLFTWPWLWNAKDHDGLGVNTIGTLWGWLQELLYGGLARLGLDWSIIALLIGVVLVMIIGWYSLGKLLKGYKLAKPAILLGRMLFLFNTYLLLLIDGGQLNLAVAYSVLPLTIHLLENLSNEACLFATVVLVISFLDFRIIYLVGILTGIHFLFHYRNLRLYFKAGLITSLILIGAHAYWLVPSLASRGPMLPATYSRLTQVSDLSFANISHVLTLRQPHWWKNIFGQVSQPEWYFWAIPIVAFFPLVAYKKSKLVAFWTTVAVTTVFLTKGSNPPLSDVYPWLFSHLPGWTLFRDPAKFFFLVALSFSVLWAFAVNYIHTKWKWTWFSAVLVIYLLLLIPPLYLGKMTGLFSRPRNATDYSLLAKYLQDAPPGKIVWVPQKPPLGYSDPDHLSINATTLSSRRPFAVGVTGAYDTLNFLRDATYSGQLLDIASVKYLSIAAIDPLRDSLKPQDVDYHSIFTQQLSSQPWVQSLTTFGSITLLQTKSRQDLFFTPQKTYFVVGSDDIYRSQVDLTNTALIFVEESPGVLNSYSRFQNSDLFLNHTTYLDVAADLIPDSSLFFPAQSLNFDPDHAGWWKRETADLISWRDFLQQKYNLDNQDFDYGGGWAVAEGSTTGIFYLHKPCMASCILLARVMVSPKGGELTFSQSDQSIGSIQTITSTPARMAWFAVGQVSPSIPLAITTSGAINVINSLALVSQTDWNQFLIQAKTLIDRQSTKSTPPTVSYIKHNPTHYTITVTNLTAPTTLAFSQNFDSLWRLDGQPPVPLYSLINGFYIDHNGIYELHYLPQKFVFPGLIISAITIVILLSRLLWKYRLLR